MELGSLMTSTTAAANKRERGSMRSFGSKTQIKSSSKVSRSSETFGWCCSLSIHHSVVSYGLLRVEVRSWGGKKHLLPLRSKWSVTKTLRKKKLVGEHNVFFIICLYNICSVFKKCVHQPLHLRRHRQGNENVAVWNEILMFNRSSEVVNLDLGTLYCECCFYLKKINKVVIIKLCKCSLNQQQSTTFASCKTPKTSSQ